MLHVLSHQTSQLVSDLNLQCLLAALKRPRLQEPPLKELWPHTQQLAIASSAAMGTPSAAHARDADGMNKESGSRGGLQDLDFFNREESMVYAENGDTYGKHLHMAITCPFSSHFLAAFIVMSWLTLAFVAA